MSRFIAMPHDEPSSRQAAAGGALFCLALAGLMMSGLMSKPAVAAESAQASGVATPATGNATTKVSPYAINQKQRAAHSDEHVPALTLPVRGPHKSGVRGRQY